MGVACLGRFLRAVQAPWATTPARTRPPPTAKLICKDVLMILMGSGYFGKTQGDLHIDGDDAGNALLLHGHANQLLGHFHGDLVVADE